MKLGSSLTLLTYKDSGNELNVKSYGNPKYAIECLGAITPSSGPASGDKI